MQVGKRVREYEAGQVVAAAILGVLGALAVWGVVALCIWAWTPRLEGRSVVVNDWNCMSPVGENNLEGIIEYNGLERGKYYTVYGVMVDSVSGEPIVNGSEGMIIREMIYLPEDSEGVIKFPFTVYGRGIEERSVDMIYMVSDGKNEYSVKNIGDAIGIE